MPSPRPSLTGRIISALAPIDRRELPLVVTAFFLFFCVLGGYFAVRPVRETVGTILGRDRVANLWLATWIVSLAIIPIYGVVVAKIRRSVFLPVIYGSVAVAFALLGAALRAQPESIALSQFFYVFISVLSLFLVSVFWSFLVELFDSGQAKRLFPIIAAGGTAGALVGPLFTDLSARTIGNGGILFVGAGLFVLAVVLQLILIRLWKNAPGRGRDGGAADHQARDRALGGNPFAGITLVLRSPYLLAIAAYVALLATANTFLYFEQLRLVSATFPDPQMRTSVFARIDWIVQSLTILAQLFITGRIASRLGLVVLLTMIPVALVLGFAALAVWNTFAVLAVVIVLRRSGEYAFVRPGREMLWTPMSKETKYKAKNFIDLPVYRGADAAVAQLQRAIEGAGLGAQTVALLGAVGAILWAGNGWWLGRRHDAAAKDEK
ncbi:MAG: MFS transporter [Verrucomicrobiota bacterium]|nr:MFS transporter [Chthoniobacterales bacterium]MDQ3414105.1 MFS transporter [Verrucomicrobiota bacterium]